MKEARPLSSSLSLFFIAVDSRIEREDFLQFGAMEKMKEREKSENNNTSQFSFRRRGLSIRCRRCPVPGGSCVVRSRLWFFFLLLLLLLLFVVAPRKRSSGTISDRDRVAAPLPPRLAHAGVKHLRPQRAVQPAEQRRLDVVEGALEALELLGGVLVLVLAEREEEGKRKRVSEKRRREQREEHSRPRPLVLSRPRENPEKSSSDPFLTWLYINSP